MIPQFPEFTDISPDLKNEIESYTHKYEPYSDFNFFSLFAWDTVNNRKVSILNDNLVTQMTDYETGEPLLSFLGSTKPNETVETLIEFARSLGISTTLRYVPEVSVSRISNSNLLIQESREDFDYIFPAAEIAELRGNRFSKKRQLRNVFERDYPEALFTQKKLADLTDATEINTILKSWQENKANADKEVDIEHEPIAIERLLEIHDKGQLTVSYVLFDSEAIAFSIDEILPNKCALAHFSKFDTTYRGINEYLNCQVAKTLCEQGVELLNWEQDLDLETLRYSKMSYNPSTFIKKYSVKQISSAE